MACCVLNIFDNSTDDLNNSLILSQKNAYYNSNCLTLAFKANCLKFISLPTVQNFLTETWFGKIEIKKGLKATIYVSFKMVLN